MAYLSTCTAHSLASSLHPECPAPGCPLPCRVDTSPALPPLTNECPHCPLPFHRPETLPAVPLTSQLPASTPLKETFPPLTNVSLHMLLPSAPQSALGQSGLSLTLTPPLHLPPPSPAQMNSPRALPTPLCPASSPDCPRPYFSSPPVPSPTNLSTAYRLSGPIFPTPIWKSPHCCCSSHHPYTPVTALPFTSFPLLTFPIPIATPIPAHPSLFL